MVRKFASVAMVALLVGCASADPAFYTLQPVPGVTQPGASSLGTARSVEVRKPGLPGYLDRSDLVLKNADYMLSVTSGARWGEPLGDMVGRVLTQDISQRLPGTNVFAEDGAISADADARVEVDIQRFDADGSGTVTLVAQIAVEAGRTHVPVAARHVVLTAPVPSAGAAGLAAAMSSLLGQLADAVCAAGRAV